MYDLEAKFAMTLGKGLIGDRDWMRGRRVNIDCLLIVFLQTYAFVRRCFGKLEEFLFHFGLFTFGVFF